MNFPSPGKGIPTATQRPISKAVLSPTIAPDSPSLITTAVAYRNAGKYDKAIAILRPLANDGDTRANFEIGYAYLHGLGVRQSYEWAITYFKNAADKGCGEASWHLGFLSQFGLGVSRDHLAALVYYKLATDAGYSKAHVNIGHLLVHSGSVLPDPKLALEHYMLAEESKNVEALYACAHIYKSGSGSGSGTRKNTLDANQQTANQFFGSAQRLEKAAKSHCVVQILGADHPAQKELESAFEEFESLTEKRDQLNEGLKGNRETLDITKGIMNRIQRKHQEALATFMRYADTPRGQCELGVMYHFGYGVPQDYQVAKAYYLQASKGGCAEAMFYLAHLYHYGLGGEKDMQQATFWYQQASVGELDATSLRYLGVVRLRGSPELKDISEAQRCLNAAHDKGDPTAMQELANYYQENGATPLALECYEKAALVEGDGGKSAFAFALFLIKHYPNDSRIPAFFKQAQNAGHPDALAALETWEQKATAEKAYSDGDYETAFPLFCALKDKGDLQSMHRLGVMYMKGQWVEQNFSMAMMYFNQAQEHGYVLVEEGLMQAKAGYVKEQLAIGEHALVHGEYDKAITAYQQLADLGHSESSFQLGVIHIEGLGVPQSDVKALKHFKQARDNGHLTAMGEFKTRILKAAEPALDPNTKPQQRDFKAAHVKYSLLAKAGIAEGALNLGVMYRDGLGVEQSDRQAIVFFKQAAAMGDSSAENHLEKLKESIFYKASAALASSSDERAFANYTIGAEELNDPKAYYQMAVMGRHGFVTKSFSEIEHYYRMADGHGHDTAMLELAEFWAEKTGGISIGFSIGASPRDSKKALECYLALAQRDLKGSISRYDIAMRIEELDPDHPQIPDVLKRAYRQDNDKVKVSSALEKWYRDRVGTFLKNLTYQQDAGHWAQVRKSHEADRAQQEVTSKRNSTATNPQPAGTKNVQQVTPPARPQKEVDQKQDTPPTAPLAQKREIPKRDPEVMRELQERYDDL